MSFRDFLSESQSEDTILQALADKDINAKIENNVVIVDSDDIKGAQKVLKSIGCTKKVKGGLNESTKYTAEQIRKAMASSGEFDQKETMRFAFNGSKSWDDVNSELSKFASPKQIARILINLK